MNYNQAYSEPLPSNFEDWGRSKVKMLPIQLELPEHAIRKLEELASIQNKTFSEIIEELIYK